MKHKLVFTALVSPLFPCETSDAYSLYFSNAKQKGMMSAGTIKNPKSSIIRHFVWDNFEFTKEPITPFRG
ncbi:MAG: hypothetical protein HGB26_06305 [Desulfobulbaceae bacterium]|nr:hypothetical protein [Desulfobulbaceae bacterium]